MPMQRTDISTRYVLKTVLVKAVRKLVWGELCMKFHNALVAKSWISSTIMNNMRFFGALTLFT